MNYEEMSDLQINLLVANAIGVDAAENSGVVFGAVKHEGDNVVSVMGVVDYCNNPSDAWPIIVANRINVYASEGPDFMPWMAGCGGMVASNRNPLRAAMIVFLMMQERTCQKP